MKRYLEEQDPGDFGQADLPRTEDLDDEGAQMAPSKSAVAKFYCFN